MYHKIGYTPPYLTCPWNFASAVCVLRVLYWTCSERHANVWYTVFSTLIDLVFICAQFRSQEHVAAAVDVTSTISSERGAVDVSELFAE